MKKVWVYTVCWYSLDDEYEHRDLEDFESFCFTFKKDAEDFAKDFETCKNAEYLGGSWYRFTSKIEEIEILE